MTTAPRRLGLDIANCTGYALSEGSKIILSGVRDFRGGGNDHIGRKGIKFYNFLRSLGYVDEIYYEKVQFMGNKFTSDGGELYKGLLMVMNMYGAGLDIPAFGVWPTTLKKAFTGHGNATKEMMCATAHAMGWQGGKIDTAHGHDEVDACALIITQAREKHSITITF